MKKQILIFLSLFFFAACAKVESLNINPGDLGNPSGDPSLEPIPAKTVYLWIDGKTYNVSRTVGMNYNAGVLTVKSKSGRLTCMGGGTGAIVSVVIDGKRYANVASLQYSGYRMALTTKNGDFKCTYLP